ncbi:flagellar basal body rod protein FlgC [Sulfitobacter sp. M57]|uniref:flagellar basal body rod protein FlgC n=1 Tax=unclassified Sulfitobacter TaxID=196795 RepID=UPI0023E346D7|nr:MULTISPECIES: flagellar basal body rod protein FlgC [unclassified Sulfitobacter]MDF3415199.1 flagellar basal body rod protein FlgC [Sulfitobacter sp. KE5]MDF3422680.1 flagellar basal body rod protein FlgC [Sulfitobacter sp. KE43]MDF3433745.1 flagellar basal body rod protein FlgC [Sulfitobacter sp. KE42]MDF3459385.1 flagellar basal body rod protein FlgC [Sulfitobacter sp. S74]MDF3463284.1 flagellar basal body rod protein FlgC [Sulfitobacter sp. Ks18]
MSDFSNALSISSSGLRAQAARLRHLSENISNADTPGYRRKTISFESEMAGRSDISQVKPGRVRLDKSELEKIHDPTHPLADATGHYDGSNVDLLIELADAREAQRSYEANLKVFEQTRKMSSGLMDLLRR